MSNYDDFFDKEFHIHAGFESADCDNDENLVKDGNTEILHELSSGHLEISDETDSDIDSIKCGGCNQSYSAYGTHICRTTCTIECNNLQQSSSNETLVAADIVQNTPPKKPMPIMPKVEQANVSCLLCDAKYDVYDKYVTHLNECTRNVKLRHFVCPVCHEMYTEKQFYFDHLKATHLIIQNFDHLNDSEFSDPGVDCIDFPIYGQVKPKSARRQIGWSVEDIYQEIDCKPIEQKETPTSSPLKNFLSKLGNE